MPVISNFRKYDLDILNLIGRNEPLFKSDLAGKETELREVVNASTFLILGGAGSIGQAVAKEIFKRKPKKLHIIDHSENNMVELVRDIRSTFGYIDGDFQTFSLDIGSLEYDAFFESDGKYDYILNLSAMKHVRSEKDPFTLMRMLEVNISNTNKTLKQSQCGSTKKYFCVSTDKAANPVNMMGASKRIMEMFLMRWSLDLNISTARFANVAFSDGSLLHGFNKRLEKLQPLAVPRDIKRYFVTPEEAGQLCLMSCIFGDNRDIFFPKLLSSKHLINLVDVATKFLNQRGYQVFKCSSEDEARELAKTLPARGEWPCYFSSSDTTGEKSFEEFYTSKEQLDMTLFDDIGVIKNTAMFDNEKLIDFEVRVSQMKLDLNWKKQDFVKLFQHILPNFEHKEIGKFLDGKM